MKNLEKHELELVNPKFRQMVQEAWNRGEDILSEVIYLSDDPITDDDIKWAKQFFVAGVD